MCCNNTTSDSVLVDVTVAFFLGLAALAKAAWWTLTNLAVPVLLALAVLGYRWTTGAILLPDREPARPPTFTRGVRATLRNLATLTAAGTVIDPLATAIIIWTLTAGAAGAVITVRTRATRRRRPRTVTATTGTPVPATGPRRPRRAIATGPAAVTWTEQTLRDTGRAA
jgi:hypothetical protein